MDFSVALTLVQTLLQLLNPSTALWREIESVRGCEKQLKKLEKTISTIQDVMLDAEQQQLQLNHTQQGILKRLNEVLYEVDDLLDEIATRVQLKSGKEVTTFLSRYNQLKYAFTKSRKIRKFRESLDDIAKDHSLFGSIVPQQAGGRTSQVHNSPRETGSLLNEDDVIIGRDDDKRVVIDMLVCPPVEERVCCVSIVGIGGLGKTTLAQLVYNDERIRREFELKMWVCVSNDFDVKALLVEILAVATNQPKVHDMNMDQLQIKLKQELDGKKYLLVLDDLWDDVTSKWDRLKTPLIGGRRASRILISTRSQVVANAVGGQKHELKGLSEAESWKLFERMTLLSRQEMEALNGEKVLEKCATVPLAIRVIGSYLRGQSQGKWMHMGNIDLANDESNGDILPVLKISYYDLPFQLKRCFSYCAIFPKDCEIIKENLISLWMAQGFIQTKGRSLEDVGEEYFMNLLHRCFFQDIKCGDDGEIISCKMHDLIHDVAKSLVGTEIMLVNNNTSNLNAEVYHVFSDSKNAITFPAQMNRMRTLLRKPGQRDLYVVSNIKIPRVESLRVLSWPNNGIKRVPKMIGELIHLRYLDLSDNPFRLLPPSITNLFNLQTLKLRQCRSLEKLPDDLGKLVNLRVLDLYDCCRLRNMPSGMRSMTYLHKLTYFVLGNPAYDSTKALEDLKCLKSLTGTLLFNIHSDWTCDVAEVRNGGYLSGLEQLKEIQMNFKGDAKINNAQALLDGLQPNDNLRKVYLNGCPIVRLPNNWWGRGALSKHPKSCLPELVEIHLCNCSVIELFPSMSQLPKLKVLRLESLPNIEYIESNNNGDVGPKKLGGSLPREVHEELVFFPSLQILKLKNLPNLKGWGLLHSDLFVFPQLKTLTISYCDQLASLPLCPQGVSFHMLHRSLLTSLCFRKSMNCSSKDDSVDINSVNVGYIVNSLPIDIFEHLSHLVIDNWNEIKRLKPVEFSELFQSVRVSSLLSLKIFRCKELRSLSELEEMWEHLTALQTLIFEDIVTLKLEWEDDGDCCSNSGEHKGVQGEIRVEDNRDSISAINKPWTFLAPTLRSLTLNRLPMLMRLPRGMLRLTSLHSLEISICNNLEGLPAWIGCFTSLRSLKLDRLPKLVRLPRGMQCLTSLHSLEICICNNLEELPDWIGCFTSLRSLTLGRLPKLVRLPRGMHCLTSLYFMEIWNCNNLEEIPAWIECLKSLHFLHIDNCRKLKSVPQEMCQLTSLERLSLRHNSEELWIRCQEPSGADWPKIQHIPFILVV
ncbi:unnamed protein product [Amaranthus hypochondriacus]